MALVLDDRVKETSTTTGTGTLNLSGAVSGFQTFVAGVGDGNTTYYAIVNRDADEWETGLGTITDATTDTLARTTVIASSNSDSAVDFSAGTKDVFVTLPASKIANLDTNNNLTIGAGSAGVDYTLTFDGADADGVITWMEDEDYFKFSDDILINSTEKLQFQDTGTYIYSNADGDLDLVSDGTAIDSINIESAGGITLDAGSTTHGITYEDDGTAMLQITNSSSDVIIKPLVDAKDIIFQQYDGTEVARIEDNATFNVSSAGKFAYAGTAVTTTAAELNLIDGGTARGTTAVASGDGILINDGGTMRMTNVDTVSTYFASHSVGGSNIVTTGALDSGSITSGFGNIDTGSSTITTTGLITGGSLDIDNVLINGTTIGHTDDTDLLTLADGALTALGTITVGVDDTGHDVKFFGASSGAYMEWDESADQLRIMGASADATTSTGKLLLATSLTDINANDVLGKIDFQAPHEAGGTDAIEIAASIQAVAQSTFSSSSNATDLIFYTGHSEAAAERIRITSQNEIGIAGANYGSDGQVLTSGGAGAAVAWEDAASGGMDWQSVVTGDTTMVAGRGYFVNTTSSTITMTLPSSASIGDEISIIDYAGTFDSNTCTIGRNSHKIQGDSADMTVTTERAAFTLVYVDSTHGWLLTQK